MKKFNHHLFIIIVLSLVTYQLKAQNTYKLTQKDDTFTYKKINLVDYNFPDTQQNKNTPKDSVIFQKSSTTNAMMKSLGALSVSETGAAIYDIPIEVPQGINGVQPAISINYNSQAGSGIAGAGWNIKGISSIKEMPATEFHGDFIDHINPDDQFMFALDGNVIFKNSVGDYGGDNVEYKTETYSNIRITSHGSIFIGGVNRPQYFKVYYPDGSIAEYGKSPTSRSINNYSISYWQNPQGLRITYSYSIDNGGQYLDKISYGNLNNLTGPIEITFDYVQTSYGRAEQS